MRPLIITLTALAAVLSLTTAAPAQTQVFEQNVVIVMGQRESQEDVRVYALAECKRLTLEKVGVYLQAETDLVQRVRESHPPCLRGGNSRGGAKAGPPCPHLPRRISVSLVFASWRADFQSALSSEARLTRFQLGLLLFVDHLGMRLCILSLCCL